MPPELDEILAKLRRDRSIDLSGYRPSTLKRRIALRMEQLNDQEVSTYLHRLRTDPNEFDRLLEVIAINYSSFFRDGLVWDLTARSVLPDIIERKRRSDGGELRVWSAGCAEGEEAHSLAILIHQALEKETDHWTTYIFGTDISEAALQAARRGAYPRDRLEFVRLGILDRYFLARDHQYEVQPFVRELVRFSRDDLTSSTHFAPADSVFGSFDVVLCRNVLIYFSDELQCRVLSKLSRALAPGGYLILGEAESLAGQTKATFRTVHQRDRIFQKRA